MTMKSKLLTLIAGGICSLGITGAASGEHMKICQVCDDGPDRGGQWISRSADGNENVIVIDLDDEDGNMIFGGGDMGIDFDFDMDFDFDWVEDLKGGDHQVIIKKLGDGGQLCENCNVKIKKRHVIKKAPKAHSKHGGDHNVFVKRFGKAPHADHGAHRGHDNDQRIEIIINGERLNLGGQNGLHELHELKTRHKKAKGKHGRKGAGKHKIKMKRLHEGDFSMGDLGLDGGDNEIRIKVLIDGDTVDIQGLEGLHGLKGLKGLHGLEGLHELEGLEGLIELKELEGLMELKEIKNLKGHKMHKGQGGHFIVKPGHKGGQQKYIIKSDGNGVWKSSDGGVIDLHEDGNVMFFGDGQRSMGDIGDNADSNSFFALGDDSDEAFAWAVGDDQEAPDVHKPRVMIGVTLGSISEALAAQLGVDAESVVMIESVMDGMPAKLSGLRRFDIITDIDGRGSVSTPILQKIISSKSAGDEVLVDILRGGDQHTFTIELAEAPDQGGQWATVDRIKRDNVRALERTERLVHRDRESAERAMDRAKEQYERQRNTHRLHVERGGEDIEAMLEKLAELNVEIDEEAMATLHEHLARLSEQFEGEEFTFEMPNIEFYPGEDENGEAFVIIEGAPDEYGRTFTFPGGKDKTFTFPGGKGKFSFNVGPGEIQTHAAPGHALPAISRNHDLTGRLNSLEERMARIEKLLERLADRID